MKHLVSATVYATFPNCHKEKEIIVTTANVHNQQVCNTL